jgi:hypothetical protein
MTEGGGGYAPSDGRCSPAGGGAGPGGKVRTVRLSTDRAEADLKLEGPPLWRRAEPQNSPELAAAMAFRYLEWVRACGAC